MTIWLASGNVHKQREFQAILPGHCIQIPRNRGITFDPDETGTTFSENALLKGRALRRVLEENREARESPVIIADDSGLCVDALGGRPGIYSARYGNRDGKVVEAGARNALLLRELEGQDRRSARFVCAMVLLFSEERFLIVQETLEGEIFREERGSGGFGYDPLFYLPERAVTVAELSEEEKNRISHRGKAGRALAALLHTIPETW